MSKSEILSNVAASIQSLIIAFAVVIGGIWSLYTFNVLDEIDRAKAELLRIEKDLNEFALNSEMDAVQIPASNNKIGLLIKVKLTNIGNKSFFADLSKQPLTISKIVTGENNYLTASKQYTPLLYLEIENNSISVSSGIYMQPKSIKYLEFYVEIDELESEWGQADFTMLS